MYIVKILITGGAGFIGSHLVDQLLVMNHSVVVYDDFSTGALSNISMHLGNPNFQLVKDTILDLDKLETTVKDADYVFHLAAAVGVFNIVQKPLESLATNIQGTENILEAASKFKKPVLITSSSEVYGKNTADKLSESDDRILGSPLSLRWSYSEAKAIDESLAFAYWTEKQLQVRIVRLFNTVGPRQLGRYGMVVPRFVRSAILGEPVDIYGSGSQTRCFAHVFDVVNAIIAVAFSKNTLAKVVNIGNSSEISIFDLATDIIRELDSKSTIRYVSYMDAYGEGFEDMDRRVPDISLINSLVGWKPTLTLKQIIADTERYLRLEMKNES